MKNVLVLPFLLLASVLSGGSVEIRPENILIVSEKQTLAEAEDLAWHFGVILGRRPGVRTAAPEKGSGMEGMYLFRFVFDPSERARRGLCTLETKERETLLRGYAGAAYWFLQKKLGVKWIRPGEKGVVAPRLSVLRLETGTERYEPSLDFRNLRSGRRAGKYSARLAPALAPYAEFQQTGAQYDASAADEALWRRRHRNGGLHPNYGHAFTCWWEKYSKSDPAFFALNKYGVREPEQRMRTPSFSERDKAFVKLCVSNPAVVGRIVRDWAARGKRPLLNVCMNDMPQGFCRCPECLKLDGYAPGGKLPEYLPHVSDRYVFLANKVAEAAKKINPGVRVVMYAYEASLEPPRLRKLDPAVHVGIVPVAIDPASLEKLFSGWKKAGAEYFSVRPNYHFYYMKNSLPLGFEKQMYEAVRIAWRHGARAMDFDHIMPDWAVSAFTDYTLARVFLEPEIPFETIEKEFMSAYGDAAPEMTEYWRYWRENLWEKRLLPAYPEILEKGRYHNFIRGLCWLKLKYHNESDFDATDAILARAVKRSLPSHAADLVREAVLANRQARLFYRSVVAAGQERFKAAKELLDFRRKHKDALELDWIDLFSAEARFGCNAVPVAAGGLAAYDFPWIELPLVWKFRPDPSGRGVAEHWEKLTPAELGSDKFLRTDSFWQAPYKSETDPALYAFLRKYSGTAWYFVSMRIPDGLEGKKNVWLYFPKLRGVCDVFINGEKAGSVSSDGGIARLEITGRAVSGTQTFFALRCEGKGGIGAKLWLLGGN